MPAYKPNEILLRAALGDKEPLKAALRDFTGMILIRAIPPLARERMSKRGYRRWRARKWPTIREKLRQKYQVAA
jgi:hypothetical protein